MEVAMAGLADVRDLVVSTWNSLGRQPRADRDKTTVTPTTITDHQCQLRDAHDIQIGPPFVITKAFGGAYGFSLPSKDEVNAASATFHAQRMSAHLAEMQALAAEVETFTAEHRERVVALAKRMGLEIKL